jgi:GTP-binding protein
MLQTTARTRPTRRICSSCNRKAFLRILSCLLCSNAIGSCSAFLPATSQSTKARSRAILSLSRHVGNLDSLVTTANHHDKDQQSDLQSTQIDNDNDVYYSPNVPLSDNFMDDADFDAESELSSINEYSFFDEAVITVRAGSGGQGSNTYKKVGHQNGPPDGGNGGQGGNVILQVDASLNTLAGLSHAWRPNSFGGSGAAASSNSAATGNHRPKSFRAENGLDGERQFKNGRYGKDLVILVPPGTVVQEELDCNDDVNNLLSVTHTGTTKKIELGSLSAETDSLVVARGGQGGEGSAALKNGRGVKRARQPATGGQRKRLLLTLKIVADVALVAVPNAGKSTLLAAVTRAKPKIANYPFTTVIPNLGVWVPDKEIAYKNNSGNSDQGNRASSGLVLCDVPGLIAGAAQGVGLGHAFLRHVERCHVILHIIDATSNDPIADYIMLNREIVRYGTGQLANMPQVVVVNKIDAFEDSSSSSNDWERGLKTKVKRRELEERLHEVMPHSRLMWMSAKEKEGVDDLMTRLDAFVRKIKATTPTSLEPIGKWSKLN